MIKLMRRLSTLLTTEEFKNMKSLDLPESSTWFAHYSLEMLLLLVIKEVSKNKLT